MAHRYASGAVLLLALACLSAGCGRGPEPAASTTAPVTDGGIDAHGDVQGLRRRAHAALEARRLHAPAGDNAAEHFLEVQRQAPDDTAAREALVALQPYVMIAAEQALARGDAGEAKRLTALLERIDPAAPSLPRLAAGLATLAAAPPRPAVRAPDDAGAETASTAVAGAAAVGVAAREAPVATAPVETATAAPPGRAAAVASPAPAPPMAVPVAAEAGTGVAARGGPSPPPPPPTPPRVEEPPPHRIPRACSTAPRSPLRNAGASKPPVACIPAPAPCSFPSTERCPGRTSAPRAAPKTPVAPGGCRCRSYASLMGGAPSRPVPRHCRVVRRPCPPAPPMLRPGLCLRKSGSAARLAHRCDARLSRALDHPEFGDQSQILRRNSSLWIKLEQVCELLRKSLTGLAKI